MIVIHYKESVKQVLFHGAGYLLHRCTSPLYDMMGNIYESSPKVLKYIVNNRIKIAEAEPDE